MRIIGLTGSIGMGKSTAAAQFRKRGIPVFDADAAVHSLYSGAAVAPIEAAFPGVAVDGVIDRGLLSAKLGGVSENFRRLEAIVHPLVQAEERRFLQEAHAAGEELAVLEIPLLFETGLNAKVDVV
ncbi:MAG: dephospho-CoA kinase, partial [Pseudomonadota bacterium]